MTELWRSHSFLRFGVLGVVGAVGLFLVFGAPILVAYALGAGDLAPMAMLIVPMAVLAGYICVLTGAAILEFRDD